MKEKIKELARQPSLLAICTGCNGPATLKIKYCLIPARRSKAVVNFGDGWLVGEDALGLAAKDLTSSLTSFVFEAACAEPNGKPPAPSESSSDNSHACRVI